jgi:hypothetical protein
MTRGHVAGTCPSTPRLKKSYGIAQLKMTGRPLFQGEYPDTPLDSREEISTGLYCQYTPLCTDSTESRKKFFFFKKARSISEFSFPCTRGTA